MNTVFMYILPEGDQSHCFLVYARSNRVVYAFAEIYGLRPWQCRSLISVCDRG